MSKFIAAVVIASMTMAGTDPAGIGAVIITVAATAGAADMASTAGSSAAIIAAVETVFAIVAAGKNSVNAAAVAAGTDSVTAVAVAVA